MQATNQLIGDEFRPLSASSHYEPNPRKIRRLKFICWTVFLLAGLVQGWCTRHQIFSDGISYMEIAQHYAEGNWKAALNSYWSPLYSWILALWMVLLRPSSYWQVGLLHLTNFLAYLACLVGFERFLARLLNLKRRVANTTGISEWTFRITGYSVFLLSTLLFIGIGYNSPDMLGMAIALFLAAILLDIAAGRASSSTYIWFGVLLALEYLARAAFAIFIPLYLAIAAILIYSRNRRLAPLRPILVSAVATCIIASPFVIALSFSKGRFTLGDAGKANYGWEVDGAARSTHWQGEPGDIGKPLHPTHKVFDHPAVYTFASPVPGSYPPWYDPSYWYAGIAPRLKLGRQLYVLKRSLDEALYLLLRSPTILPVFF